MAALYCLHESLTRRMSELPNPPGQSYCGAGFGTDLPVRTDARHASMAGSTHGKTRQAICGQLTGLLLLVR
jgi:hypothetical protein